jgi:hypothetical protein|tara:strand:+ start:2290 stop:2541 length:252 start_codon:yes stop_codon:yes gene_type:complete
MVRKSLLGDPVLDKVFKVLIQVAGELYVTKTRLKMIEMSMNKNGQIIRDDLDNQELSSNELEAIEKERDRFIETILSPIVEGN